MKTSVAFSTQTAREELWALRIAASPLIGTAIHNGHEVWPHLAEMMAIDEAGGEAFLKSAGLNLPQDVCTVQNADSVVALLDSQRAQAAAAVLQ